MWRRRWRRSASVVIQIIYVVQFLAAFSIFAGDRDPGQSSIAGTRYRRIREVVVLKTLGATRARIATIFSIEFAVLGLVAGVGGRLLCKCGGAWAAAGADGSEPALSGAGSWPVD